MRVNLGEKIKELRRRDNRTQEALANAIGVTSQAVSRWEANGGYPDVELLPAIANYFHITIDELFGYNSDRALKIEAIIKRADALLNAQGDMTSCTRLLREAIEEFPSEAQLFIRLGYALTQLGWQKYGARAYTSDGCDYVKNDISYNSQNEYWKEALSLYGQALSMGVNSDDKSAIVSISVRLYAAMGLFDQAEDLANRQDPVMICREVLLAAATDGEKRDLYQGEALLALLRELKIILESSVGTKVSICSSGEGVRKLLDVAHLYESILDDGNCGAEHADLRDLYLHCAFFTASLGNVEEAVEYFDRGFEHEKKYESIRCTGVYHYTAPLVSKVTFLSDHWPSVPVDAWKSWLAAAPIHLVEAIKAKPKYAECFAWEECAATDQSALV